MTPDESQASTNQGHFVRGGRLQWFSFNNIEEECLRGFPACASEIDMHVCDIARKKGSNGWRLDAESQTPRERRTCLYPAFMLMLSSLGSVVLRLGAWSYLPDFATQKLLLFYHSTLSSRGVPPRRGSPRWQAHYRIAYSISVLAYLLYNLVEAARSTPPNFYEVLGVSPSVDEATLRSSYRTFAKRFHPDRAGPGSEPLFMTVQNAYEALKNPMKRFGYERFGPNALTWRNCSTSMDYLKQGIMQSTDFYIVSSGILVAMSVVMKPSPVAFWRYILFLSLSACEMCLAAGPRSFGLLGILFPNRVAFQHVLFLHQLFVFLSVALSRVIPVLFPEDPIIRPENPSTYAPWLQRLEVLEKAADVEVLRLLHLELHAICSIAADAENGSKVTIDSVPPCNPPREVLQALTSEMEDVLVEQFVRAEPPLRALWDEAVRRRWEAASRQEVGQQEDSENEEGPISVRSPERPNDCSRLPSLAPTLSPEIRPRKLYVHAKGENELEPIRDDESDAPLGSPPTPTQLIGIEDELRLQTNDTRSFIRVVSQRSLSPQ